MATPDLSVPFAEADVNRLETLLASMGEEAMTLDALQGFFYAVASGPEAIMPSRWIPVALGEDREWNNLDEANEGFGLLMRFFNHCVANLMNAGASLPMILYGNEAGDRDFQTWCLGYLEGVDLSEVEWHDAGESEVVDELLAPIVILAGELAEDQKRKLKPDDLRELEQACRDELPDAVIDLHRYFLAQRSPRVPVRRDEPKVGRNDPCPCGSGKKFKQCHGAPGRLH